MYIKIIKPILVVSYETVMSLVLSLPRFQLTLAIKNIFLSAMGAKIGSGVIIYPGCWITPGRNLILDDDVVLSRGVLISSEGGVSIGKRTQIGYGSKIFSSNHSIPPIGDPLPISGDSHLKEDHERIVIGKDVWVGANCVILPGVKIGEGAVIAAGAVVVKDVEKNTIVAGVPCKLIGKRK